MARTLVGKTNTDPAVYPYVFGKIRDNPGNNTGTALNENTCGDQHQFFEGLLAIGNVTPNNLPENALNGFQYSVALQYIPKIQTDFYHTVGFPMQPSFVNSFASSSYISGPSAGYKKGDRTNRVYLQGAFQRSTELNSTTAWTMPLGYRPASNVTVPILMRNNSLYKSGVLTVNAATGDVQVHCDTGDATTTAIYIIDGASFALD